MTLRSLALASMMALPFAAPAADFSERGATIFKDALDGATMASGWTGKPGTWEMAGGAVRISEKAEDKHAAVRRHKLAFHDAIFEFSFQFDGAKSLALSINDKGGHVCRMSITPVAVVLQTDKPNAKSDRAPQRLVLEKMAIAPGTWHKAELELRGKTMLARIDGRPVFSGENAFVDVDKTDFGFAVSGVSAQLKEVRVFQPKR